MHDGRTAVVIRGSESRDSLSIDLSLIFVESFTIMRVIGAQLAGVAEVIKKKNTTPACLT